MSNSSILRVVQLDSFPAGGRGGSSEKHAESFAWIDRAEVGNFTAFAYATDKDRKQGQNASQSHARSQGKKLKTTTWQQTGPDGKQEFVLAIRVESREQAVSGLNEGERPGEPPAQQQQQQIPQ
jgi:hypothetical protein